MRCFLIGLVAKKTGGYRLITHLSHPPGLSVNEHIDDAFASVKYSNVDSAVTMMKTFGTGCLISTVDIKSAFRLLPCYPGDFDLFGFKFQNEYFIDKMAPMGLRISCCAWEKIATFLNWLLMGRFGSKNVDHYLDDFFFAGSPLCSDCANLMSQFDDLCEWTVYSYSIGKIRLLPLVWRIWVMGLMQSDCRSESQLKKLCRF